MSPAVAIQAQFADAINLHQAGHFGEAEIVYEKILKEDSDNFPVIYLLGLIALQTQDFKRATELIGRALSFNPDNAGYHLNLGNALKGSRQFEAAITSYEIAIQINPDDAAAYSNRGIALKELKQYELAIASFNIAIEIKPDYAEAYSNRGNALKELHQLDAAIESYDKAISIKPDYHEAFYNLGNSLKDSNRFELAIASYNKAIELKPDFAEAYSNLGIVLMELKQFELAITSFNLAIIIKPDHAEAFSNRGNALHEMQRFDAAIESYDKAISIKPDYHEAYSNRGNSLKASDRLELAIASYQKAIAIKPDFSEAYSNLGNALTELKQFDAALDSHDTAIKLNPVVAQAYSNRGNFLLELRQLDAAIADFDKAISIAPDKAEFHLNKSFPHLLSGDLKKGWKSYEWRLASPAFKDRQPNQPRWSGQTPLHGQTVLIHSEQGLGDVIQFCRYAKLLEDSGARVLFEAPRPLLGLLQDLAGVSELIAQGDPRPAFDLHCPLLSLPMAFGTTLENIPRAKAYLSPRPDLLARWTSHIGKAGFKIGISWQGSTDKSAAGRSFPVQQLHRIAKIPGVRLISLQKNAGVEQLAGLPDDFVVETLPEDFDTGANAFLDSAAVLKSLDLMITCDTALAHLAGALGVPTWLPIKLVPYWTWMLDRSDSPWYPNHRLFRQELAGVWDNVFEQMASALSTLPGLSDATRTG